MSNTTKIGTFELKATETMSVPQEFAGASVMVEIPPGVYDVVRYSGGSFGIRFVGEQVYSGWFGTNTRVDHERQPAQFSRSLYSYHVGQMICSGEIVPVEGVTAEPYEFVSLPGTQYEETRTSHRLFIDGKEAF